MFNLKRMHTSISTKITINSKRIKLNYKHTQALSIHQYHHQSIATTFIIHKSQHSIHSISYNNQYHHFKPYLYHSKHNFTVTPLEPDGTLSLLQYGDKQIYLIGTAHISASSADQVRKVIQQIKPDTVFVELCPTRAEKIWIKIRENQGKPQKDIVPITSEEWLKELPFAKQFKETNTRMLKFLEGFGFVYGGEFYAALEEAENVNASIVYGDRDVKETMQRLNDGMSDLYSSMKDNFSKTWKSTWTDVKEKTQEFKSEQKKIDWYTKSDDGKTETFGKRDEDNSWSGWFNHDQDKYKQYENMSVWEAMQKGWEESKKQREKIPKNNWSEIFGFFTNPEATIEAMKDRDKIREKFGEFRKFAPELVKGLVDERDEIMAYNLKQCKGKVIVAVVGVGHMDGMEEFFKNV